MSIRRSLALVALALVAVPAIGDDAGPGRAATRAPTVRQARGDPATMAALAGPAAPADLDVMTFNLRHADSTPPNSWAQRRPVMRALLRAEKPDLIGTQEGLSAQLRDIRSDLGAGYSYLGLGRDGGDLGEHMAVFFNTSRLRPEKSGDFWLSPTPDVPASIGWHAAWPRMVTWALFTDLRTGRRFYAVNTHLDNRSEDARRHGAQLIAQRTAAFDPLLPVVLTGDFNSSAEPADAVHHLLVDQAGLHDSWTDAARRGPAYATIHNYGPLTPGGIRADWILTTPDITTVAALMDTYRQGSQYPSDHLPVECRLRPL